jgi:aspartate aminotransferase
MFEVAAELKTQHGEENIFDFTLGNPIEEPPPKFKEALRDIALNPVAGMHRYMPNSGYLETRRFVADELSTETNLPFTDAHIVMTNGAAGGVNIALKALLDPGDEVIIPSPYFVEFRFYVDNHGGVVRLVDTNEDFSLNLAAIEDAITERTKVVLINTPNNPTGVLYTEAELRGLANVLKTHSEKRGAPIYLISDEAYRAIIYNGATFPSIFGLYEPSISVTSYSKSLNVPGERIGYVAVNPLLPNAEEVLEALVFLNRTLGYINAPALMQRLIPLSGKNHRGVEVYQKKRDILYAALTDYGYSVVKPQGAFYLFPESPIPDDLSFVTELQQTFHILTVPGRGFGKEGYFRISYCVEMDVIERALPGFRAAAERYGLI